MHAACTPHAHRMHTACTPHAHRVQTACTPHAHRMHTACAPHVHCRLMWKAYYNNATMATHTGFASWDFFDWSAVAQRRTMHKCRAAMARRARRASNRSGGGADDLLLGQACAQHVHSMCTACAQHVHSMCTSYHVRVCMCACVHVCTCMGAKLLLRVAGPLPERQASAQLAHAARGVRHHPQGPHARCALGGRRLAAVSNTRHLGTWPASSPYLGRLADGWPSPRAS